MSTASIKTRIAKPQQTFAIEFLEAGILVQRWGGYLSYADAGASLRDADSILPFTWFPQIVSEVTS